MIGGLGLLSRLKPTIFLENGSLFNKCFLKDIDMQRKYFINHCTKFSLTP